MRKKRIGLAGICMAIVMGMTGCGAGASSASSSTALNAETSESAANSAQTEDTESSSAQSDLSVASDTEAAEASTEDGPQGGPGAGGPGAGGPGGAGGGMTVDKSSDTELQEMIADVAPEFTQGSYTDEETGLSVPYDIYVPEDYDSSKSYPMVVFIGDMTTVGTDMEYPLTQGWGGLIWASDAVQDEQECIVLVPVYPEVVINDNNGAEDKSDYLELTPHLIESVASQYSVDTDRIYGTGQSMGAMTTLYLAANNPDLYAAVLIVDGQWDTAELKGLESQKVFYIAAGGDEKASQGQEDVKAMLDADGVSYAEVSDVDAQASADDINSTVKSLLSKGKDINFLTWTAGSVLAGTAEGTSEHMASFDYAYKCSAVRDWLLAQSK